jgi:glucose-1-phosphate adenylyltransferase
LRDCLAVVLAGGKGDRLSVLSEKRAKPAVPFGGKYRLIDFTLSNCTNSGVNYVIVLTQYRPRSLEDHIRIGKPWDFDRKKGGIELISPYLGRKDSDWFKGTADAIYQNRSYLRTRPFNRIIILSGDHVYLMDYSKMYSQHIENAADLTIATLQVKQSEAHRYGILELDTEGRVLGFEEKPKKPRSLNASMGVYIFEKDVLLKRLEEDAEQKESSHDFGKDIIPAMLTGGDRVFGYRFSGYWRDVGTLGSYFDANQDLLKTYPELKIDDPNWQIYTNEDPRPPAKFGLYSQVVDSIISTGCIINGRVENSVLSPGIFVEEGAKVNNSILLDDCRILSGSELDHVILDKHVVVQRNSKLGSGGEKTPNKDYPQILAEGISVVGKNAFLPANLTVGRNVLIYPDVEENDFGESKSVVSGSTVYHGQQ